MTKRCPQCATEKPRSAFGLRKNGKTLQSYCRDCNKLQGNEWAKKNRERATSNSRDWRNRNHQRDIENARRWREANRNKTRGYARRWYYDNLGKVRANSKRQYYKNRDRMAEYYRQWIANNPGRNSHNTRMYEARKKRAIPQWANDKAIAEIYLRRDESAARTGMKHHVDHIVPLFSDLVCGLHVESNLRVIPARENQCKSNKTWPDMP